MSPLTLILIAVFLGVSALVGAALLFLSDKSGNKVEDRLDVLTGIKVSESKDAQSASILNKPIDKQPGILERFLSRFTDIDLLFEQADVPFNLPKMVLICMGFALVGTAIGVIARIHYGILPVLAVTLGFLPIAYVFWRRKRRMKAFAAQLPDAMEMLARALRAGQSLPAGFHAVSQEMAPPLGPEFGRVFEEQNLGISIEDSLEDMTERVPNVDLRFFATSVILQRQTGGDLAEILDKIGYLIRERFQIWGQVQALTGEGRLSGIILMALPILLFVAIYQLNPDYVKILFTHPMGKKMLVGAIVMQVLGALVIRKIVNIKV